jgi:hypothetical protein
VRLIDREEGERHALQPDDRVLPRKPLRREIEESVRALRGCAHNRALFVTGL